MWVTVKQYGQKYTAAVVKTLPVFALFLFVYSLGLTAAHATTAIPNPDNASDIAQNIVASSTELPGILAAISYLLGILLGTLGILKIKDHVENPGQNPVRNGYIRLIAGGALFALPMIFEAIYNTVSGGASTLLDGVQPFLNEIGLLGTGGGLFGASNTVSDIGENIVKSGEKLPALIAAAAWLLGLLLATLGILKIKDHVENPTQTALRIGVIRLIAGGALFALPTIYNAVFTTISGGASDLDVDTGSDALTVAGLALGGFGGILPGIGNFSSLLRNIAGSINDIPGLISAAAYLLGLLLGAAAIIKAKDHIENPDQNPLKDSVIRFLIAGALFALPTIYNAMFETVGGGNGNVNSATGFFALIMGTIFSSAAPYEADGCGAFGGGGADTMGGVLCTLTSSTALVPAFLTAISYIIGLVFGFWGVMKIKAHVQNPQQTSLWEPTSRLIAGGAFLSLPFVIDVIRSSVSPTLFTFGAAVSSAVSGYNYGSGSGPAGGLDGLLVDFMTDMMGPLYVSLNFFSMLAGTVFIMIGISRLIKTAQDGARGPGGLGTMMTFLTGGALLSFQPLINAFNTSVFREGQTKTFAELDYQQGMTQAEADAAHATITAIIQFIIIVGLISFVRGIFIIRGVGEGSNQASIMSGITHILAGTLAVNLGPLLNAVQTTLGLTGYGITFG